jgi:2-amino-4-hydroxy-6-hydroxymethyldihydropteridine diphosphokinase
MVPATQTFVHRYLVGLGSNRPHPKIGAPRKVLLAALAALADCGDLVAVSPIIASAPLGPSRRRYANAVAMLDTELPPRGLLTHLKAIEAEFGRRRGQRWSARVLDLDIVVWDGGAFAGGDLVVPHPRFRERGFVLGPARMLAPHWRDPVTALTLAQLDRRLTRPRPLPR